VAGFASSRAWSDGSTLGLRADLTALPEPAPATIPVRMEHVPPRAVAAFTSSLDDIAGDDRVEVARRLRLLEAGLENFYLAQSEDGEPIYAQWLVPAGRQALLHDLMPGLYPELRPGEGLLEGAYTFPAFRGKRVMADAVRQVLVHGRDFEGLDSVLTYVAASFPPAIAGCARAGFGLDHTRHERWRLGVRRCTFGEPDGDALRSWTAATAPR